MTQSPGTRSAAPGVSRRAWSNPLRATARTAVVLLACGFYYLVWRARTAFVRNPKQRMRLCTVWTRRWAAALARCCGIRIVVDGPPPPRGSLLVPNHSGYLDVLALGAVVPCFFVAKLDVEQWPIIGTLFKTSGHVGVSRTHRQGLGGVNEAIAARLAAGESVCVFLEGTSTGNDRLLPFHPPLAEPAIQTGASAVPVAIRWSAADDRVDVAEDICYWKDHVFARHAWRFLGLSGISAQVTFGNPVPPDGFDRKAFAAFLHDNVKRLSGLPAAPLD